ncbi:hypothetical protein FHG87_016272 [Trinorchestia longiramus]|nr:hypothetical protein FHG87_016272 [Trinorchestia longiramus]
MLFPQDNVLAHRANATLQFLGDNFKVISHGLCLLDLAPSDFWLFPIMKDTFCGLTFANCAPIALAIFQLSKQTPEEAFAAAMESWRRRCENMLPLSTCHQAVANTAVVDGILVKWTAGPKETAAYLTLLTRLLHDSYQDKCVSALRSGRLPSPCPVGSSKLVEFQTFNKSVVKNRQLSVREMLAKHLLQVAGLSVQKVAAIVNEVNRAYQPTFLLFIQN